MMDDREIDEFIAKMLDLGIIEVMGFDSISEQVTYRLTPKCKELMPELFQEHFNFVNEMAFDLWNKGYIEVKFDVDGSPMVMLKDLDYYNDVFPELSDEERFFIENMIEAYKEDGGII